MPGKGFWLVIWAVEIDLIHKGIKTETFLDAALLQRRMVEIDLIHKGIKTPGVLVAVVVPVTT